MKVQPVKWRFPDRERHFLHYDERIAMGINMQFRSCRLRLLVLPLMENIAEKACRAVPFVPQFRVHLKVDVVCDSIET